MSDFDARYDLFCRQKRFGKKNVDVFDEIIQIYTTEERFISDVYCLMNGNMDLVTYFCFHENAKLAHGLFTTIKIKENTIKLLVLFDGEQCKIQLTKL